MASETPFISWRELSSGFERRSSALACACRAARSSWGQRFRAEPFAALFLRVGDVFEEDEAEDDGFVFGGIHGAAEGVGGYCGGRQMAQRARENGGRK